MVRSNCSVVTSSMFATLYITDAFRTFLFWLTRMSIGGQSRKWKEREEERHTEDVDSTELLNDLGNDSLATLFVSDVLRNTETLSARLLDQPKAKKTEDGKVRSVSERPVDERSLTSWSRRHRPAPREGRRWQRRHPPWRTSPRRGQVLAREWKR